MAEHYEMGTLFPEIDKKKTVAKVNRFMKTGFPRAVRQAGSSMNDLRSPNYDGMPKGSSGGNAVEETITRRLISQQVVQRVIEAMSHCSSFSRKLLRMLYFNDGDVRDWQVEQKTGYAHTRYEYYKSKALLEFADAYMLDDLHEYL
ncbi:hypothetical protein IV38_GL000101 [Lactobacillus selangorensis]|uniref:Uncharacterized protein n=1 Tax=Lactobacillus selangorensis TaxID=81857 RepID=A0A0R2FS72_9LACO|nr:ArpU family phage packaging/lysis transcriptional regulator [Lactobacillus selangorensis]KRN29221.1 hypothetical protein IV38_GL000101 [Lactobacillus selangorensis]KRN31421.1 hypothetical protein IV40_GL001417 [Lactobacillus selangorensis]